MRLWPELSSMTEQRRLVGQIDVIATLWSLPLSLIGLGWLVSITDLAVLQQHFLALFFFGGLQFIFHRLSYFIIMEIRHDRYGSADGSLVGMVQWAMVFLFGPSALWVSLSWMILNFVRNGLGTRSIVARWITLRTATHEIASLTLGTLVGVSFYQYFGGKFPLPALSMQAILPAFSALAAHGALSLFVWSVYFALAAWTQYKLAGAGMVSVVLRFLIIALGLPILSYPFAIQAAGIYTQNNPAAGVFFMSGLILVAFLGRRLSWAAESNRQRSRQLEQLERLGREIINTAPEIESLSLILAEHVPAMFPSARVAIHLFPDQALCRIPVDWKMDLDTVWRWGCQLNTPHAYQAKETLPWEDMATEHDPVVLAPILSTNDNEPIGCIYVELRSLAQPWNRQALTSLFPALKTLADQIASALHQAQLFDESLDYEQAVQELKFAGRIQSSFLPNEIPTLDGWELAVTLLPARETSGDFFDFIPLPDGKMGILIADVADKGVGAAIYMALCRTLLRTYALEYLEAQPDVVFFASNERLLKDARANLFVTAFYGVLDPVTNTLTYCNAGHNPPYLFSRRKGNRYQSLSATGMPLGVEENEVWKKATIRMEPGDVLVLYTDGVPDAQDNDGNFFRDQRLTKTVREYLGLSAQELMVSLLGELRRFTGDAPQFDDITLLILLRNE